MLLVVLVAIGAPPIARLLVALPAAVAASGYLQAWFRFCAGFGSRGVYNFGALGSTRPVEDGEAHRRDRSRACRSVSSSVASASASASSPSCCPCDSGHATA